ncbi:MAG: type II toxin-antitoxin system HicA family toxin [Clostridia bacterium]
MPMTPKEMIKLLENNGFKRIRSNGSHIIFRSDLKNKSVTVPYHSKALKPGTERSILKLAGLK